MVVPAIATPAAPTGNEPAAPAAADPASSAPASPQGDPNAQGTPPSGQEPAGGGDPQAPAGNGGEPSPKPEAQQPQEPRRLTQEEWEAQQQQRKRAQDRVEWDNKAKELTKNAPVNARDLMDDLAERLNINIPTDLRKPFLELVQNLVDHGTRGAELNHGDEYAGLKETLDDTSLAFIGALDDAKMRDAFAAKVKGQEPKTWVDVLLELKRPAFESAGIEKAAAALAEKLPEGAQRTDFLGKYGKEHDAKKLAQGFHDALVGVVGPGGEPRAGVQLGSSGRPTLAEVTRRRAAGEYKTDKEFLEAQDLALQGT